MSRSHEGGDQGLLASGVSATAPEREEGKATQGEVGDFGDATEVVGPLETVLETIPVYAQYEVRLKPSTKNLSLTDPFTGDCRRQRVYYRPPLVHTYMLGVPPAKGGMAEMCRKKLKWYTRPPPPFGHNVDFIPAISRAPREDYGPYPRTPHPTHYRRCFWASRRDSDKSPVYRSNGLAGTGKSIVAQTIAEKLFAGGFLGASLFCSRDFEAQGNLYFIFSTLAVQPARQYTELRSIIFLLIQSDPGVTDEFPREQINKLIVQPLAKSAASIVTVVGAWANAKTRNVSKIRSYPSSGSLHLRSSSSLPAVRSHGFGRGSVFRC